MIIRKFLGFKILTDKKGRRIDEKRIDDAQDEKFLAEKNVCFGDDIVTEILMRLPVKVLLQCKCISKHWFQLISSSYFRRLQLEWARTHHKRILYKTYQRKNRFLCTTLSDAGLCLSSLDINNMYCTKTTATTHHFSSLPQRKFLIVGSCDGLVCLFDYKSIMVLCNPTTKECVEVPLNIQPVPAGYNRWFDLNFAHDPLTDTYKVVRLDLYYSTTDLGYNEVYVYTLGTKVWRKIPVPVVGFRLMFSCYPSYVHGAFHWFRLNDISTWFSKPQTLDDANSSIISFDVGTEEFRTVPLINGIVNSVKPAKNLIFLGVLQECLSIFHQYGKEGCLDIWLMKDYGVKESWTKVFSFSFERPNLYHCAPIIVLENGELIIGCGDSNFDKKGKLYAYNIQNRTISKAIIPIVSWKTACIFVESLVSISSIGTHK